MCEQLLLGTGIISHVHTHLPSLLLSHPSPSPLSSSLPPLIPLSRLLFLSSSGTTIFVGIGLRKSCNLQKIAGRGKKLQRAFLRGTSLSKRSQKVGVRRRNQRQRP
ncbi:hypothetical protein IE53DRAFT_389811, partial [Violaceomyces palustris]